MLSPVLQISDAADLNILAKKINVLVEQSEHQKPNYVELGRLLTLARDRVRRETRFSFPDWCDRFLVKKDGRPFSYKTLENYMYLSADPVRVEKQKAMQRTNIKNIRKKASSISTVHTINALFTKQTSDKDQCDILMAIWEQISEKAQERFLQTIGARL